VLAAAILVICLLKRLIMSEIKVYFIRPKPRKNFDNIPVFLSVAFSEEQAWGYVLEKDKDAKDNYYVDDIFISQTGQSLGLMWGNERSI